jgi:hypothetical protein
MCLSILFALVSITTLSEVKAQTPSAAAFTGIWVLDKEKTSTNKDFPQKLRSYRITVDENEKLLRVKSEIDGQVQIEQSRDRAANNTDIIPNEGNRSSVGRATGGVSATTLGTAAAQPLNYGGTMALFFTTREASYNLSGDEVRVDIKQGEQVTGVARIRAKLDKSGNQIQFTNIRRMNTAKGDLEITTREVWKLSKDGKSLRFERSVETSAGARDLIVMMLTKTA